MMKREIDIDLEELLEIIARYAVKKAPEMRDGDTIISYNFDIDRETYDIKSVSVTLTSDKEKQ